MDYTKRKTKKYTNFSSEDIKEYLVKLKKAVLDGKYTISINMNRQENKEFIEDYKITSNKEKEILLGIEFDDFCYSVDNDNEEYAHEVLYIFCKRQKLDHWGSLEPVDIYIKINMTRTKGGDDFIIVVSFHKRNKPIEYLFK